MTDPRHLVSVVASAGPWRPQAARTLLRAMTSRHAGTRDRRLAAAADWLRRAQAATVDGGVSWGYQLGGGWAASYPETTGYIVPTYLALEASPEFRAPDGSDRERAARAIDFLASVRLADGSFPGARIDENQLRPSVFNTAQILHGLTAWRRATGDEAAGAVADAAAAWLVSTQDDDGAWRRFAYHGFPVTYLAHGSCWLAEHADLTGEVVARSAAERHLDWVLRQYNPETGWFDLTGFTREDHAARRSVTHTLAYTIWGVLTLGLLLGRDDAVEAAASAATRVASVVRERGRLPGMLSAGWADATRWACLTGNSQMALVWFRLAEIGHPAGDPDAARTVLDRVLEAQDLGSGDPGIRGGIPGSDPPWGTYMRFVFPNWAAKFTIDALLEERRRAG
ncbi:MAG: prenyltransferase/squalene oxidase repeat-containing protein [Candidatus Limnocylindrales bacterium]